MKNAVLLFLITTMALAEDFTPFNSTRFENHQIILLNHGLASFEERLQMIERAQSTIDVEYFIYNLDKSGKIFSEALIKKAREGVKVRMLLDYFMVKSQFSPFFAHEMEKNGIEVKYFNATSTLNLGKGQYRNHRKVLLIDGVEAITGGRNIGDEYFDLREDYNFLDRDIEVKGAIVKDIQETFNQVWNAKVSKKVEREKMPEADDPLYQDDNISGDNYKHDLSRWQKKVNTAVEFLTTVDSKLVDDIRGKGKEELANEYHGSCDHMIFHSELPIVGRKNRSERIIKHDISERLKKAEHSVVFDSPYFIVNDESKEALETALSKNVEVKLLTNSLNSTDAIYVYDVFDSIIKPWIKKGLQTYIYKGSIPENYSTMTDELAQARFGVHAKSFIFDQKDVIIGTFNFDPRSANFNTEMTIACEDNPELARVVGEDIERRMKNSIHLDSSKKVNDSEFYNIGFFKKIEYYLLKAPSNMFDYLL